MSLSFSTSTLRKSPATQMPLAPQQGSGYASLAEASRQSYSANTEEMARLGVDAIFRLQKMRVTQQVLTQIERRDRAVLMLQDGRRTLRDVARLLHRSDTEIAQTIVRLLQQEYVEFICIRR